MSARLLVVEDRPGLRKLMASALEQEGFEVTTSESGDAALKVLDNQSFDLVLTDLKLPGKASGIDVVAASRARQPETPVVVLSAFGTVGTAVEAMKLGAADFLEKPLEIDELISLVHTHTGSAAATTAVLELPGVPPIVGGHPTLRASLRLLRRVAPTESTVLLTGESGTGKELFARALHALSPRQQGPLVAVNCAAIPEPLMENELFGHERGAFTGALKRQKGRFEQAAGGTLFLDEIGELQINVQGKVLRVLEERTFERVGSGRPIHADVRLVAATNRDLSDMVERGEFRSDLYFRLEVFPIRLPPLRERLSDIPALAEHLIATTAKRLAVPAAALEPEAAELLAQQPWPGNIRQLANVLERALILDERRRISATDLGSLIEPRPARDERQEVRQALIDADGDKQRTADLLGISLRTLQRKIRDYDLEGIPKYRL